MFREVSSFVSTHSRRYVCTIPVTFTRFKYLAYVPFARHFNGVLGWYAVSMIKMTKRYNLFRNLFVLRSDVFSVVSTSGVVRVTPLFTPVDFYRPFRGTYCLRLQATNISILKFQTGC